MRQQGVFNQERNMESRIQMEQSLSLAQQYDFGQYFPYLFFSLPIC